MLALLLAATLAQSTPTPVPEVRRLRWNPKVDLPVTAVLGAGWLTSEFGFKKQLAPAACKWCGRNALDESVRSLFAPDIGGGGGSPAGTASDVAWPVTAVAALGTTALLAWRDDALAELPIDAVIIFEATFATMAVNQTVKFIAGRERPFVSRLAEEQKGLTDHPTDNNLSFFSGHAGFTMSLAVAAGTVAHLRGYRLGWLVFAVGVPLSLTTGILRLAADKHYFSDVLIGWLVGAGIGFGIPWAYHQPDSELALRLVPAPGGLGLAGRF